MVADIETADLKTAREAFAVTQTEFAKVMGMSMRAYQDLEGGVVTFREVHKQAARMAMLILAERTRRADMLPDDLKDMIRSLNRQIVSPV